MCNRPWFVNYVANRHVNEFRKEFSFDGKQWMTIDDAATYIGVNYSTIWKYIKVSNESNGEYAFFSGIIRKKLNKKGANSILLDVKDVICFKHAYNFVNNDGKPKKMTMSKMKNIYFPHATILEYMFLYCEGVCESSDLKVYKQFARG